jgi:propionyl-CoA carboxylase beta chain
MENPPFVATSDPANRADERLNTVVPEQSTTPYDIRDIIHNVVDENYFSAVSN